VVFIALMRDDVGHTTWTKKRPEGCAHRAELLALCGGAALSNTRLRAA